MQKYSSITLQTTSDCVAAAQTIKIEARQVQNLAQHKEWWNNKVDFEWFIDSLLQTGGFGGKAYSDLRACKDIVYTAERIAGQGASRD